jgi:hypothetical protein
MSALSVSDGLGDGIHPHLASQPDLEPQCVSAASLTNEHVVDHRLGTEALQRRANEFAAGVGPMVVKMREAGQSLRKIASALTGRGVKTARGGAWTAAAVRAVLERVAS